MVEITRRFIFGGAAAAIVAAYVPATASYFSARQLPVLELPSALIGGLPTMEALVALLNYIGAQIRPLATLSSEERHTLSSRVDNLLEQFLPLGVALRLEATPERLALGNWTASEARGVLTIG